MLSLERKAGQSIAIGEEIVVTVLKVGREKISIGIDAPKHLDIQKRAREPGFLRLNLRK